jgi:hypothetical protein
MPVQPTAARIESQPPSPQLVSLNPAKMGLPETIPQMRARLARERREARAAARAAAKSNSGSKIVTPSFDLLAGIDRFNTDFIMAEGEESKVVTFKVPGYVYSTYRRVHSAFIEKAKEDKDKKAIDAGSMLTSAVYHWLKTIMDSVEAQGLIDAFHDVETAEGLTPFQESELQDLIENRRLPVSDPFSTTAHDLCFRLHPGIDSYVSSCVTALRIEKTSLIRPCLMKGLSGQPGCNPANVEPLDAAYIDLIKSCESRIAFILRTLKGQLAGNKGGSGVVL